MVESAFALKGDEILPYIKIESLCGKKATEILAALQEVDPTCDIGFSTVCSWVQKFTNDMSTALQNYSSGRPISVTNEENTEIVAQILKKDRQFTCEEIAHETIHL